jgi:hypothetical protein
LIFRCSRTSSDCLRKALRAYQAVTTQRHGL